MNYRLAANILKAVWAIEPRTAFAHGSMLAMMLNNEEIELSQDEKPEPFAVSLSKGFYSDYDEAERGSVAVIPVIGELTKYGNWCAWGMADIGRRIVEADNHENISAIVLKIDSPGGTVDGTEALAQIVKSTQKPIVSFVDGMMCSAALWVGTSADEVIASTNNDEIGSIGVMISFADVQPYWEERGIKFHKIVAEQSKDKNLVFYQALQGNYDAIKKDMLNPLAESFIEAVKENRPNTTSDQHTGKVFFAKDLIGTLVDSIGNLDHAVERALSLIKPEVKIIKI